MRSFSKQTHFYFFLSVCMCVCTKASNHELDHNSYITATKFDKNQAQSQVNLKDKLRGAHKSDITFLQNSVFILNVSDYNQNMV